MFSLISSLFYDQLKEIVRTFIPDGETHLYIQLLEFMKVKVLLIC